MLDATRLAMHLQKYITKCALIVVSTRNYTASLRRTEVTQQSRCVSVQRAPMVLTNVQQFIPKLKDHLLGRLTNRPFDSDDHDDFTSVDRNCLRIAGDRIYPVKKLQINYTTYDVRRDQDLFKPAGMQCDVMVLNPLAEESTDMYWYARMLGVYHTTASIEPKGGCQFPEVAPQQVEFLWVRWLGAEPGRAWSFRKSKLPMVGFVQDSEEEKLAFGFLDPAVVIRGCHLIPTFSRGKTTELLESVSTLGRSRHEQAQDWLNFYVNV